MSPNLARKTLWGLAGSSPASCPPPLPSRLTCFSCAFPLAFKTKRVGALPPPPAQHHVQTSSETQSPDSLPHGHLFLAPDNVLHFSSIHRLIVPLLYPLPVSSAPSCLDLMSPDWPMGSVRGLGVRFVALVSPQHAVTLHTHPWGDPHRAVLSGDLHACW